MLTKLSWRGSLSFAIFLNEVLPLKEKTRDLRALASEIYGKEKMTFHERLTSVYRPLYAPFEHLIRWVPPQARLIDIGCGTGCFMLLADRRVGLGASFGFDTNERSIRIASRSNRNPEMSFQVGTNPSKELLRQAQVVSLIDVIHHIPAFERFQVLDAVINEMPAGARLLVKDLDSYPRWKAWANQITDYLSTRSKVSYLGINELESHLRSKGLRILTSERLDKHIWSHYLVVAEKLSS